MRLCMLDRSIRRSHAKQTWRRQQSLAYKYHNIVVIIRYLGFLGCRTYCRTRLRTSIHIKSSWLCLELDYHLSRGAFLNLLMLQLGDQLMIRMISTL
jgi:hypothetical protein